MQLKAAAKSQESTPTTTCGNPSWKAHTTAQVSQESPSGTLTTTTLHLSLTSRASEVGLDLTLSNTRVIPLLAVSALTLTSIEKFPNLSLS